MIYFIYLLQRSENMLFWKSPDALVPERIGKYNYTVIYDQDGIHRLTYCMPTVLKDLASARGMSLPLLRRTSGRKLAQPLYMGNDLILVPLKMQTGKPSFGYVNLRSLRQLGAYRSSCSVYIKGGWEIPVLWSLSITASHLQQATPSNDFFIPVSCCSLCEKTCSSNDPPAK
jgi:hypothetical protein